MNNILFNFFYFNDVQSYEDIIYLCKTKGTDITEFHLSDGRILTKHISLKYCQSKLPSQVFININKGLLINKHYIKSINRFTYHLKNGESFDGRLKSYKFHQQLALQINDFSKQKKEAD